MRHAQHPLVLSLSKHSRLLCLPLLLAACAQEKDGEAASAQAKEDDHVRCLLPGMKDFAPVCARQKATGGDGPVWTVHHPDGGFRRFVLLDGGMRIATADGAEEVQASQRGADLEVRVANDRYLFAAAADAPLR